MTETTHDTFETLLDSVRREIDEPVVRFKLRIARQLNVATTAPVQTDTEPLGMQVLNQTLVTVWKTYATVESLYPFEVPPPVTRS